MSRTEAPSRLANPVITVHDSHAAAESTVTALSRAGFDVKKLSILGKGDPAEEHATGSCTAGDRHQAVKHEASRFLVIVHGSVDDVAQAHSTLASTPGRQAPVPA
jgi:hypothetical protein